MSRVQNTAKQRSTMAAFPTGLLLLLSIVPMPIQAAVMGEITVESVLNEPFFARIELVTGDENPEDWDIAIGDQDDYRSLGLERESYADLLRATLVQRQGMPPEIYVEGRFPVTNLFLDVVIAIKSDGNRRLRHWPVLIDFPALTPPVFTAPDRAPQSVPAAPVTPVAPLPQAKPRKRPKPIAEMGYQAGDQIYQVKRGDNLYSIAKQVRGNRAMNINDVMDALFFLNPEAFIRGDINLISAGASLRLPDLGGTSLASEPTQRGPGRTSTSGGRPIQPDESRQAPAADAGGARLELRGAPDTETIVENLNTWLESDESVTKVRVGEVRRDLAFAAAEIETYRKENDLLKSRIEGLEDRVIEMERLLTMQATLISSIEEETGELQGTDQASESQAATIPDQSVSIDSADVAASVTELAAEDGDSGWILFPGIAAALLVGFGLLVFLRSVRDDRARRRRTAELTSRLRNAPDT